jgi:hypothetical protein
MAYFAPADRYGWFVVKQLEKGGHGRLVSDQTSYSTGDPFTAIATALFSGLLNGLNYLVTKMVARFEAGVNRWLEKRELERIIRRNELYRLERKKERERQRPPMVN